MAIADAEGCNAPEGNTRTSAMARRCRSAGVLRPWHAGREASKNLGDPSSSYTEVATVHGIQLLRHRRGNPDTEQCWNLNTATHHETNREAEAPPHASGESYRASYSAVGKAHDKGKDVTEVRSPHRTLLPDTVGPDHQKPTSLQGIANKARVNKQHRFRDRRRVFA